MLILSIFLLLIVGTLFYVFFAPFYFEINNIKQVYRFRFHRLASADLKTDNNTFFIETRILGWKKQFDLLEPGVTGNTTETIVLHSKKKETRPSWKKIKAVIKSFKVNTCFISIDTGDMPTNGILYPLFFWLSHSTNKNIEINFIGETKIIIEIKNSLARMSWAYISS